MKEINDSVLDSIAACGDVNRNTMCNPNPYQSKVHKEVNTYADIVIIYFQELAHIMKFG